MSENKKKTLRKMERTSSDWSKYGLINEKTATYSDKDLNEEDKKDIKETHEKMSPSTTNASKNKNTIKELTDYFNESFSSSEEESEKEIEVSGDVNSQNNSEEEEKNENANTYCGQDIPNSQQEIEQNTEDVNIPAKIRDFQPTKEEDITQKETMLLEKNTANANDESFVTFKPEPAEQKKEKENEKREKENELRKATLEYLENLDASQTVRDELNNDKKFHQLVKKFSNETTPLDDIALKIAIELMSPKIKRKKLFVDRDVRGNKCVYRHIDEDNSWQIEIGEGGWFQKGNYRIDNKKNASNGQPKITQKNIDGKNFTFVLK